MAFVPYRTQFRALTDSSQGGSLTSPWVVAHDLPDRLKGLRKVLGDTIPQFTRRFGRRRKQYYSWIKGTQQLPLGVLEEAAHAHGWPRAIFEEGGERPEAVNWALTPASGYVAARLSRTTPNKPSGFTVIAELDRAVTDLDQARARLVQLRAVLGITSGEADEARWIEVAKRSGAGEESPPHDEQPSDQATG